MPHPSAHVMKISRNGQVSIPAVTRARWRTDRVIVVDLGDRVVLRPLGDGKPASLRGKYRDLGPDTLQARRSDRAEEAADERR